MTVIIRFKWQYNLTSISTEHGNSSLQLTHRCALYIVEFCCPNRRHNIFTPVIALFYFYSTYILIITILEKRKYDNSYMWFGFTFTTERDGTQKPQYFIAKKSLQMEAFNQLNSKNILLRYFLNAHQIVWKSFNQKRHVLKKIQYIAQAWICTSTKPMSRSILQRSVLHC